MDSDTPLKFTPLQSCVDVTFWSDLGDRKLNSYKLSDQSVPLLGWFGPSRYAQLPGQLQLEAGSFNVQAEPKPGLHPVTGMLTNFNTLEAFKTVDKMALLSQACAKLWSDITCGAAELDPSLLTPFSLITFADLKRFQFRYWFLFPALKPPAPILSSAAASLDQALGADLAQQVAAACDVWRGINTSSSPADAPAGTPPAGHHLWLVGLSSSQPGQVRTAPISEWSHFQGSCERVMLAISDISNLHPHPGWPLRNALLLAAVRWKVKSLQVVCVRDLKGRSDPGRSLLCDVMLPDIPDAWCASGAPDGVGWEAGPDGRLAPRFMDLSAQMSPHHLAEQAVDLNLHLMKWRAAPELNTQSIAATKCLLLGAGTLGCAVSRTLLAWGVRNVTFLDSSKVAFSNPVRQSLFEFNDCLEGGKPKAQAAADALSRIFPSVHAQGVAASIPMPGHPPANPTDEAGMQQAAAQLDQLVQEHDVVFLLTDTRESRWLPTLLAAVHNKLAITAAVGFDGFLVMRHGPPPDHPPPPGCPRLGCYFCNDVVAPINTTRDRTLDQQCTVARPGLAPIASAIAVELLTALLQHPLGVSAPPAGGKLSPDAAVPMDGVLGPVPHMIRGQLSGFQQTSMEGHAFSQCTACSQTVVEQYRSRGWSFLLDALKEPRYLEDLTGLTLLQQQTMDMLDSGSDDDDDDEGGDGAGTSAPTAGQAAGDEVGGEKQEEDWTSL